MKKAGKYSILVAVLITAMLTSAFADWRKEIGIFRIGVITKQEAIKTIDDLEPFKRAISKALEMDVEIFPARSEDSLIQALSAERIEYAILSNSGYALSWILCECVEPLVSARTKNNGDTFHNVLITGISGPSDPSKLSGTKIGVIGKHSISGHPFSKYLLKKDGIKLDTAQSPFTFHNDGMETLKAFQAGELSGLIGWSSMLGDPTTGYSSGTLRQLAKLNGGDGKPYKIIWNSPALPYRPHVIRKKLNGETKQILRNTMRALYDSNPLAYDVIEPKYGGGFVLSKHEKFESLIEFVQSLYQLEPDPQLKPNIGQSIAP